MKTIRKALVWSIGVEVISILLVFGGRVGLGFLTYLALAFHLPALYVIDYWPAVRQTLIGPIIVQWLFWFILFVGFFMLRQRSEISETPFRA